MFCYQCQETAGCTGCTRAGVCGKSARTAALQDLLVYVTRGLCQLTTALRNQGEAIIPEDDRLVTENLFVTITNANFDDDALQARIRATLERNAALRSRLDGAGLSAAARWDGSGDWDDKAQAVGVLSTADEDIRSLRELITYGLKGMAAYNHHVNAYGKSAPGVDAFLQAALAKTLDAAMAPLDQRRLVLSTAHKYRYALTDNLSKVAYAGSGETLRNAELGRVYTLDTYMDQNCPDSLSAAPGTAGAYQVTGTAGATVVALTGVSAATATVKKGDCFILDGYRYHFTEDKTAVSGAVAQVGIDCELVKDYTNADAYVVSKPHSLAFHRNAIALVTRPLALPMGDDRAAIISGNGLGVRVVYGYDQDTKKDTVSLDVIYGIQTLDDTLAVKLVG